MAKPSSLRSGVLLMGLNRLVLDAFLPGLMALRAAATSLYPNADFILSSRAWDIQHTWPFYFTRVLSRFALRPELWVKIPSYAINVMSDNVGETTSQSTTRRSDVKSAYARHILACMPTLLLDKAASRPLASGFNEHTVKKCY